MSQQFIIMETGSKQIQTAPVSVITKMVANKYATVTTRGLVQGSLVWKLWNHSYAIRKECDIIMWVLY